MMFPETVHFSGRVVHKKAKKNMMFPETVHFSGRVVHKKAKKNRHRIYL